MNVSTHHVAVAVPADKLAALYDAMNESPYYLVRAAEVLRLISAAIHDVTSDEDNAPPEIWKYAGTAELCAIGLEQIMHQHGELLIVMSSQVREAINFNDHIGQGQDQ
ncbi:hypothetical protein CEP88_12020 [Roseobacter denitrificans]|uniref:Uncharacterized protein n=1 Tax=Roseobacter denitrificans (strain ATCC 33942 / OCh 114) TaxID=375451 RepID=Q16D78_ROSDO|nr:hypothetical protein [Roseobacter denitrificans]ABG30065.1 hypothetical protein RD1_0342 [Roseobacter denitrificans OCh 114]AVL53262.1 hypothetical protein CEP88_12020 [Roseobacter denitrificans]SFF69210.1 hypothetical protein SAMN05443635_10172 [Roseobacter denitrificans OCh 114]